MKRMSKAIKIKIKKIYSEKRLKEKK